MSFKSFLGDVKLNEAVDLFPEVDVIKFDPDRIDMYDVVNSLMPTLARVAYVILSQKKVKYDSTHTDEEDEPFEFTKDALEEELSDVVDDLVERLNDQTMRDRLEIIDKLSGEFKDLKDKK